MVLFVYFFLLSQMHADGVEGGVPGHCDCGHTV